MTRDIYSETDSNRKSAYRYFAGICAVLGILAIVIIPKIVFAASTGHGHAAHHAASLPPFADFISHLGLFWMNFALFLLALFFVLRKVVAQGWAVRRATILTAVESGALALRESEQILQEAQGKMSRLSAEITRVRTTLSAESAAEAAKIGEEAQRRSEQIIKRAHDTAESEARSFEKELEKLLFEEALKKAKEKLTRDISQELDSKIRARTLDRIAGLVN